MSENGPADAGGLEELIRRQEELLAHLRTENARRAILVADLRRRRDELAGQLADLDAEIRTVLSAPPLTTIAPGERPAVPSPSAQRATMPPAERPPSLKAEIRRELAAADGPLTDSRLAERILGRGYQTRSKNFTVVIRATIGEMRDEVEHVRDGYRLRAARPGV